MSKAVTRSPSPGYYLPLSFIAYGGAKKTEAHHIEVIPAIAYASQTVSICLSKTSRKEVATK